VRLLFVIAGLALMLFASSEAMAQAGQTVTSQDIQPGVTNGESMPPVPRARPENEGATQPSVRWPQVVVPERPADPFIDSLPPFGASLFESPGMAGGQGPHPDYQIDVGDQILVSTWGQIEQEITTAVDPQGNIFLPGIGPVSVRGVSSGSLSQHVEQQVRSVYRENVGVYATLASARAIGVFVTGYVDRPGRFPGAPSESVIDFLAKAGGVDPNRGSYRDISILRNDRVIARADLYNFLLAGRLPRINFQEGDTILVGQQRSMVAAEGDVRNNYRFEFPVDGPLTGAELIRLARPLPKATHARIIGSRSGEPEADYIPLAKLETQELRDQDRVTFGADEASDTIMISVSGAHLGPSTMVASRNASLLQLMDYIEVDPQLAAVHAVHLRRESVARQQKASLEAALDRLERSLVSSTIDLQGEATIRRTEAEMVMGYIERARQVQPDGTVVVVDSKGRFVDLRLEDGDEIIIPPQRGVVLVSGEVTAPQAMAYEEGKTARFYLDRSGGLTDRGDSGRVILRRLNGQVELVSPSTIVRPGDEVIAPPRVDFKGWVFAQELAEMIYQIAVISRVVMTL
jgi:protein involved in polysaccharide export with SLBB domain